MTVAVQTPISSYTGNGVTTAFSFGYYVAAQGDLVVMVDGVVKALTTDYTLTGIGSGSGGTCTFVTAPASGADVVLYRDTDLLRETDYQDNGDLLAAILNGDFDRIWLALQEIVNGAKSSARNVRAPIGETINELPDATTRAGKILTFNASTGQPEAVAPTSGTATDLAVLLASTDPGEGAAMVGVPATGDAAGFSATRLDLAIQELRARLAGHRVVTDYGAVANDDTGAVATANTEAFRDACLSYKTAWNAQQALGESIHVFVPPGDYNLDNGFTVPKGVRLYGAGMGASRIKILGATAAASGKLPLISMGRVIDASTGLTEVASGVFVTDPAPQVENLYLNPQNSNTAVYVNGVPGFVAYKLWVQADIGFQFLGNAGDGLLDDIMIEDSSGVGLDFVDCQNINVGKLYTFAMNTPIRVSGDCNNIDIAMVQANYSKVSVVQFNDTINAGRVRIGHLTVNQNVQYGTFTSCVRLRSASCDLRIDSVDARNYNGFFFNNETGVSNVARFGSVHLRQTPNNSSYTLGTTAAGFNISNCDVYIQHLDASGLSDSPFNMLGTFRARLYVEGALIGTYTGTDPVCNITNTSTSSEAVLHKVNNKSGNQLFNANAAFLPKYRECLDPFPQVTEGGRFAIKLPYLRAGNWKIGVTANTNNAGNVNYRRTRTYIATVEAGFNVAIVTNGAATSIANTGLTTAFTPDIAIQVDIGTVGAGAQVAYASNGTLVLSVPNTYTFVAWSIESID